MVTLNKEEALAACAAQHPENKTKKTTSGRSKKRQKGTIDALLSILEDETHLLEEDDEPFQVLPNGHISAALFVALRVLCSGSGTENNSPAVESIGDALRLPGGGEDEMLDLREVGAVQVWQVTDKRGALLAENEAGAHNQPQGPGSDMVTAPMCRALAAAIGLRVKKYPTGLKQTQKEVEKVEKKVHNAGVAVAETQGALRAALTLRLTEQQILEGMEMALRCKIEQARG